ncbi:caspase family protein [Spirillospora sp. NPDC048819]|uniref:caspase, EACC1-associated type n=1 Tax=Spirillospora sp. NPDC048819 TaxID=3155268 RepID=UPI0033F8FE52
MTARPPDPEQSRVVLIGVPAYTYLDDLPAVEQNVRRLRELLTDPGLWGLPERNCAVVVGDDDPRTVPRAIRAAARGAEDLLFVYYAGHGLLPHDSDKFCLALPSSTLDDSYTAIRYEDVRLAMAEARPGVPKVMFLDCCFAARALEGAMGAPPGLSELSRIEGACTLTACDETSRALAPPGDAYTAFTGEFIRVIENGITGGSEYLDLGTLFHHLRPALEVKGLPQPQFFARGDGGTIPLFRNRAYSASSSVVEPSDFPLPEALHDLVHAQLRAADDFPYQLVGARQTSLASVYIRQEVSATHAEGKPKGTATDDVLGERQALPLEVTDTVRAVEDTLRSHSHLVITGGPGQGKSTLTLQLTAHLAGALISRGQNEELDGLRLVPVRVMAAALAARDGPLFQRLRDAAAAGLGLHLDAPLPDQLLKELPDGWRWLVMVDGLDEITDPARRETLIRQLAARAGGEPSDMQLLITTRPLRDAESALLRRSGVGFYRLEPFSRELLRDFSERWFSDPAESAGFLHAADQAGPSKLVRIPLLATITAIVYEQRPGVTLPGNRYVLYQNYLSYLRTARAEATDEQWRHIRNRIKSVPGSDPRPLDYLRANLQELLAQLAEAAIKGTTDLGPGALEWIDRHGGGTAWVSIPEWPALVAGLLDSTGLFVHTSEGQRFIHHSFAEHLAGQAAARRIPEEFDPERTEWAEPLRRAMDGDHVATTALIAHSYEQPDIEALLEWAENGDGDRRALSGRLLAEGIRTPHRQQHATQFLEHCEKRLHARNVEYSEHSDLLDVISKLGHVAATDFLRRIAEDPAYPPQTRIKAASVQPPAEAEAAAAALREIAAMPRLSAQHRAYAARSLGSLGPRHVGQAVAIVRGIIDSPQTDCFDRASAADDLAAIAPEHADQAAAILRQIMNDARNSSVKRAYAASWFAKLGYSQEAAETLEEIITSPQSDSFDRCYAVDGLASIAQEHTDHAVAILHETMTDAEIVPSMRAYAAWRLTRLRPDSADEAAQIIRSLIVSPDTLAQSQVYAASMLGNLGEDHNDEAITALRQIMNDPAHRATARASAALSLAENARKHLDEALAIIRGLLESPRCDAPERVRVAEDLAELGAEFTDEAVEVLQQIADCPDNTAFSRANAAGELAKLAPDRTEEAAAVLRSLTTSPDVSRKDAINAARRLAEAEMSPRDAEHAAGVLRSIMSGPGNIKELADAAAELGRLSDSHLAEATRALRALTRRPPTGFAGRATAARHLAKLAPDQRGAAVTVIRAVATGRVSPIARLNAVTSLDQLGTEYRDETVTILREIITNEIRPYYQARAAGVLGDLSPCYRDEAVQALRGIMNSGASGPYDKARAADELASLSPAFSAEAADVMRGLIEAIRMGASPWNQCTRWATAHRDRFTGATMTVLEDLLPEPVGLARGLNSIAKRLAWLGPAFVDEAAEVIRGVIADPNTEPLDRADAGDDLTRVNAEFLDEGLAVVEAVLAGSDLQTTERIFLAPLLVSKRHGRVDTVRDILRGVISDFAADPADRAYAAYQLADLGQGYIGEADAVLREVMADSAPAASAYAAGRLAESDSGHVTEAAELIRGVISSPSNPITDRILAAAVLSDLSLGHPDEAAQALRDVLADPLLDESDHDLALTVLDEISPRSVDQYRSQTPPP